MFFSFLDLEKCGWCTILLSQLPIFCDPSENVYPCGGSEKEAVYSPLCGSAIMPTGFDLLLKELMPGEVLCGRIELVWGLYWIVRVLQEWSIFVWLCVIFSLPHNYHLLQFPWAAGDSLYAGKPLLGFFFSFLSSTLFILTN